MPHNEKLPFIHTIPPPSDTAYILYRINRSQWVIVLGRHQLHHHLPFVPPPSTKSAPPAKKQKRSKQTFVTDKVQILRKQDNDYHAKVMDSAKKSQEA